VLTLSGNSFAPTFAPTLSEDIRFDLQQVLKNGECAGVLENAVTLHVPHAARQGREYSGFEPVYALQGCLIEFLGKLLKPMRKRIITLLLLFLVAGVAQAQKKIPTPAEVFGFTPGEDRKLASWDQVVDYFKQLDSASDRVVFETLGNTTMGKPFVMATISSPANLARLEEFKKIQDQLADPRKLGPLTARDRKAAELIRQGKTIVLITCGIHSKRTCKRFSTTRLSCWSHR
jgi:hypothetical protein